MPSGLARDVIDDVAVRLNLCVHLRSLGGKRRGAVLFTVYLPLAMRELFVHILSPLVE